MEISTSSSSNSGGCGDDGRTMQIAFWFIMGSFIVAIPYFIMGTAFCLTIILLPQVCLRFSSLFPLS